MRSLVKRNLLIFFRDKSNVFFSLLSTFIIIGLYILFLGDVFASNMPDYQGVRFLMDSWIMAGLLAVTPITTVMGKFGDMILDKHNKIYKDFAATPVKRNAIAGGYIISGLIISFILTFFTFMLAELYIIINGGELLTIEAMIQVFGIVLLANLMSGFMMFFIASCFKSIHAYSAFGTIIGTLIGFLTGIYIPIGNLPEPVQMVVKIFPPSHVGVLLRQVMMKQAETITFANAPSDVINDFHSSMGIAFDVGDTTLSATISILYLLLITIIFGLLSIKIIMRKEK